MKTVSTPKGTLLPLTNLKGKDYLMVAYRIQWLNEETPNFLVNTQFPVLTDTQTVCTATVEILDKDGKVVKKATGTKRECKSDFSDHTEKAETSAIGRALATLGFGTQFALADLDEGERIVDGPVVDLKTQPKANTSATEANKKGPGRPKADMAKSGGEVVENKVTQLPTKVAVNSTVEEEW